MHRLKLYPEFESTSLRHVVSTAEKFFYVAHEKRRKGRTFAIFAKRNRTGEHDRLTLSLPFAELFSKAPIGSPVSRAYSGEC